MAVIAIEPAAKAEESNGSIQYKITHKPRLGAETADKCNKPLRKKERRKEGKGKGEKGREEKQRERRKKAEKREKKVKEKVEFSYIVILLFEFCTLLFVLCNLWFVYKINFKKYINKIKNEEPLAIRE